MSFNILIVDDSAVTRAVLKKTISMTDLPVNDIFQAADGHEALEQLHQNHIDLVLTDLNMPNMNGMELIENIRADENIQNVPITIITTESSTNRINQLREKGINGYIHKPFTPEQVRDEILNVLQMSRVL
ncbi:MAG: response regulator [Planctomycetes bacterium]|nr:response regulator [Planctomycetota bacterium]